MVSDNLLWNTKPGDNLIEHEVRFRLTIGFKGRHCLLPLPKVAYNDNDILVPPNRHWVAGHEIHPPLGEWSYHDEEIERIRMQPHLSGVELTWMTMLYILYVIFKYGWTKILVMQDLLGCC